MGRSRALPAVFATASDDEDVRRDVAQARRTTMAERARILESLCRMAAELTAQHQDPGKVLAWQDPVSEETERLLRRLRRRPRRDA